jgi:hypothetical protein
MLEAKAKVDKAADMNKRKNSALSTNVAEAE